MEIIDMVDWLSLAIGFVVGTLTGAAGHYFGQKYTDRRRSKEFASHLDKVWKDLETRFPKIINEMKADVKNPRLKNVREFFIKSSESVINSSKPCFIYHTDVHPDLVAAIAYMVELGYITDITLGNCPKYRMKEHFIDKLRET